MQLVLNNCDQKLLLARMALAQASRAQRTKRIRAGVKKPRASTDAAAASGRAAEPRTRLARQSARRLASVVREIEARTLQRYLHDRIQAA
jgi:hypothetical protein